MLFNSLEFPVFLAIVLLLFWLLKETKHKQLLLLGASLFFYGYWKWTYLLLLLATASLDYLAAIGIGLTQQKQKRLALLCLSILANLVVLGFFKYSDFLGSAFFFSAGERPDWLPILLPVGISFYTFQAMSYVIDVYRNRMPAEKSWTDYMLFITFFPQLVAGPIERAPHLLSQLKKPELTQNFLPGALLLLSGFFKKILIADRLAVYVDAAYNQSETCTAPQLVLATIFFGFQIYCDFSGYSDIARGCASFFGIKLMRNFKSPYSATDLGDFWRRWHISLSGWFRDYLYQPLGGGQGGTFKMAFNIMLVFSVSGLWHGANWTFLAWGIWHGTGLVFQRLFRKSFQAGPALSKISTLIWVFMGWFFFRVNNLDEAELLARKLISLPYWNLSSFNLFHSSSEMAVALSGIAILMLSEKFSSDEIAVRFQNLSIKKAAMIFTAAIMVFLWFGHFKGGDFIYFQF